MKRYISIILILLCFFVLNNLFAYTSSDNKQISYFLELNKSGVNKIYFAESATIDKKDQSSKIKNSLYAEEIYKLAEVTMKKLEEIDAVELFKNTPTGRST